MTLQTNHRVVYTTATSILAVYAFFVSSACANIAEQVQTPSKLWAFEHEDDVNAVAYAQGVVYSGGDEGVVRAVDAETGEPVTTADGEPWVFEGHDGDIQALASTGNYVYVGGETSTIHVVNTESGEEDWTFDRFETFVDDIVLHGEMAYAGGRRDSNVRAFDTETGEQQWVFKGHEDWVQALAIGHQGEQLFSGARDNTIRALDATTGEERWSSDIPKRRVKGLAAKGDMLYSTAGREDKVRAQDVDTQTERWIFEQEDGFETGRDVVAGADGLIYASGDETLYVIDAEGGNKMWTYDGHSDRGNNSLNDLASDGYIVYTASNDNTVHAVQIPQTAE